MDAQILDELLAKLADAQEAVLALSASLNESQWLAPVYSEGAEWTAADIYRHLVDAQSGMIKLMERIRAGGEGVPADFDLQRWNARAVTRRREMTSEELRQALVDSQQSLLDFMAGLEPDEWQMKGRHASLRIMSIEEICHQIADHKFRHSADIRQALDIGQ